MKKLKFICAAFVLFGLSITAIQCKEKPDQGEAQKEKVKDPPEMKTVALVGKREMKVHAYKEAITPFQNSYLTLPDGYKGPRFELKHDYPANLPQASNYPWKTVTNNGYITQANSLAYVQALKEYVSPDMRKLLYENAKYGNSLPWWQSIWLGSEREPIHGLYVGSSFPSGTLGVDQESLTTFVYTLYDATAAVTLNKIWGTDVVAAENPKLMNAANTQYAEGSVIVKFAFFTGSGWAPTEGAATWMAYTDVDPATGAYYNNPETGKPFLAGMGPKKMRELHLLQFDIIVKDSEAAPKTGWVFSTLVYDKDAPGADAWDKMVPLGATWGDNPEVIDISDEALIPPVKVNTALTENWINMNTPDYARSTLGWDGRLSGPNDGAVIAPAITESKTPYKAIATVGCLGCHSSAQYEMKSFLLSVPSHPKKKIPKLPPSPYVNKNGVMTTYDPGSKDWMKWFQNRDGETPMDAGAGQVGLDYDMVTAFKAIPMWKTAMKDKAELQ